MDRIWLTRLAGAVGGTVLALAIAGNLDGFGRGLLLAPLGFGFAVVIAVAVGETLVKPPAKGPRTASLTPRRIRDYVPRRSGGVVLGLLVAVVGVLTFTTLTASADETLGGMRALSCFDGVIGRAHTPYAGSHYSLPLAGGLLLVVGLALVAARQVVLRPRGVRCAGEDDDALRRRSLEVIVAGVGVAVGATLAGAALVSGEALRALALGQDSCAETWSLPAAWILLGTGVLAGIASVVFLVQVLAGQLARR